MFVYKITNQVNGKIYIGKTTGSNLSRYLKQKFKEAYTRLSTRSILYAAIRKHGQENFTIEPLFVGTSNKEICAKEVELIALHDSRNSDVGYNICRGGEGFTGSHSPETCKRMSLTKKRTTKIRYTENPNHPSFKNLARGQMRDYAGQKFGRLTATRVAFVDKNYRPHWECLCDCGNVTTVAVNNLRRQTRSCGCLRPKRKKIETITGNTVIQTILVSK